MKRFASVLALAALVTSPAAAHPIEFGVMTLTERSDGAYDLELRFSGGEDTREPAAPWLDESCRLDDVIDIPLDYGLHIRGRLRCEGGLLGKPIGIRGLEGTDIEVPMTISSRNGHVQSSIFSSEHARERVEAHPSQTRVLQRYLLLGIEHIAIGVDHLLLVLGLLLASRKLAELVATITSFTVGHSITLAVASLGWVHVPGPPVEACIALSLVLLAVSLVRRDEAHRASPPLLAITFGLLHGFGFAGALADIGLPASALGISLLGFNLGVELGQLGFVAIVLALGAIGRRVLSESSVERAKLALPEGIGALATFFLLERLVALGA